MENAVTRRHGRIRPAHSLGIENLRASHNRDKGLSCRSCEVISPAALLLKQSSMAIASLSSHEILRQTNLGSRVIVRTEHTPLVV